MTEAGLLDRRDVPFELYEIDLETASDEQLLELSRDLGLNLSLDEMHVVRDQFRKEGRRPTDVELQSIGQAWSEHCCYKSSKRILKQYVFAIDHPDVLARGDAGVMAFDDDHAYALRLESHNHPSAIEPYGGAATGIGGILRDVLCMGAQPIALVDPLFFGPPDLKGELPAGVKHPRYLVSGVVAGIRDYGNRVGVPTVSGGVFFDERYTGNCLVNVGCLGIVRREDVVRNAVGGAGDVMILCGGRTGRDGIHGVTFASAELSEVSEEESRGAVQLGDPIMKEPLMHACLEVNRRKLITGMKDLGGGGLSCVVGEMALDAGCGAEVELDLAPLKEEGLAPWEVWVSESQERMMLAAEERNVKEILEIFELWDVPATVIGRATADKRVKLSWKGVRIFDMDLEFLTAGPEYCRPCLVAEPPKAGDETPPALPGTDQAILALLSDHNIASKEWMIRQYDHEVRGSTILKPIQGKANLGGPGDASVLRPVNGSWKGLAVAVGCNPWFTSLDPCHGGRSSVDEVCRNLVAVGARPHSLTDCLNFGNPEKPDRLGEFREAVKGIGEVASAMQLPIPSGNVSLYNETPGGAALPTPVIMGVGVIDDVRKAVSTDLKNEGDPIYVVGETRNEMGGSALFRKFGGRGGAVPDVDVKALAQKCDRLVEAMGDSCVRACHDCSDGGLAIALAEMCIGGGLGAKVDLRPLGNDLAVRLFSESNGRWVVEVDASRRDDFERTMGDMATPIGVVGGDRMEIADAKVSLGVEEMRKAWNSLWELLG